VSLGLSHSLLQLLLVITVVNRHKEYESVHGVQRALRSFLGDPFLSHCIRHNRASVLQNIGNSRYSTRVSKTVVKKVRLDEKGRILGPSTNVILELRINGDMVRGKPSRTGPVSLGAPIILNINGFMV